MGVLARKLTHDEMIHKVWPDKSLFGAVMLFITGLVGVSFVAFNAYVDVTLSEKVPGFLRDYPPLLTLFLSFASFVLAGVSLKQRNTMWALWGAAAGVASLGLLGVGSLLSIVAFVFLILSRLEKEDYTPETLRLTTEQWPDKSLAASLLMTMSGIVALVWGVALAFDYFSLELSQSVILGQASIVAAIICLFAASQLYYQKRLGFWIGVLASVAGMATLGFYVVGPLLSISALVLLLLAHREEEFHKPKTEAAPAMGKAAR